MKAGIFGKDPNCVCYHGHSEYAAKFEVDDWAAAYIRLEGGITVDFRIGWAMNMDTPGDTIILGTKGGLRVPSTECWNGILEKPCVIYHEVAGMQVETEIPLEPNEDLWDLKARSFLDAAKNGGPAPVSTREIFYNQAILDAIAKSSALGREVALDLPDWEDI
jgi:predicted dehydrogenase